MKITFLGAAENVTGSRFLLETEKSRLLIDCGLFQERALLNRNWDKFPVPPESIDTVLLTHAHIDHCGYLPRLVADGFKGKIICTSPSVEISKISLLDTGQLQDADAQYKARRHKREDRQGPYPVVPLFTADDAKKIFGAFVGISYNKIIDVAQDITATYYDAGHILGSAMIKLAVTEKGREKTILFSGDIGRWDRPVLNDPTLFTRADYVIMEATYGDRIHENAASALEKLERIINETQERGGNIVIPSFAIGRTQEILHDLSQLFHEGKIDPLLTFVDSPMAMNVMGVFKNHQGYFDEQAQQFLLKYESLFDFPLLKFTPSTRESQAINQIRGTTIIIAGSGMCTGGRIKHHLGNNISRPESTILFVGYQATGTLGRTILERPSEVRILGRRYDVRARIEKINGFSAHADKNELLRWVTHIKTGLKKVFIVHAEKGTAHHFADALRKEIKAEVRVPQYLEEFQD